MEPDFNRMRNAEGEMIRFKNKKGDWSVGRIVKVRKDGLEIEELSPSSPNNAFGFGFGGGPFWGPPIFYPIVGFVFFPFFFW